MNAGAHALFVQSVDPQGGDVIKFCQAIQRRKPIFLAPTRFPHITKRELFDAGASHIIFANHALLAAHHAVSVAFSQLEASDCEATVDLKISRVSDISQLVGEHEVRSLEALLTDSL